ncbi:MAG: hypothetical protein ACR2FQ_11295 [Pseudonocardiaceae bacterium]
MRDVKTVAKAGGTAGAAVGTSVKTVREGAQRARKQLSDQVPDQASVRKSSRRARKRAEKRLVAGRKQVKKQVAARKGQALLADRAGDVQDRWETAQDILAERVHDVRRDLAGRIDPAPTRRRRWPLLLLLVVVSGVATAAALARRPQLVEPVEFGLGNTATRPRPVGLGTGAPEGNGAVNAEHPSATTD